MKCGRKSEYPKRTHAGTRRTCRHNIDPMWVHSRFPGFLPSWSVDLNPLPSCCEATALTIKPTCYLQCSYAALKSRSSVGGWLQSGLQMCNNCVQLEELKKCNMRRASRIPDKEKCSDLHLKLILTSMRFRTKTRIRMWNLSNFLLVFLSSVEH